MSDLTRGALHLAWQITGSREEARDILQHAVLKSLEHARAPRPDEQGYRAWFYRVVHNLAIDSLRLRRRYDANAEPEESPARESDDPEALLDAERRREALHRALARLPSEQREIICLKDFHDFSYDDIARIMDIPRGTVMSRLHRARLALRRELEGTMRTGGRMQDKGSTAEVNA